MKWIFTAILIGLVSAGGLMAWASPPDATGDVGIASAAPAGSNSGGAGASVALPAPIPREPDLRNDIGVKLIGTAVVEGGPSIAFLQLTTGTRFVREGDEIVAGMRLVKVWRNQINIERAGVRQEIRTGSNAEPQYQASPGSIGGEATQGGRMGRSLYYKALLQGS